MILLCRFVWDVYQYWYCEELGGRVEFRWKRSVNTASCCLEAVLAWCLISLSDVGDSNVSSRADPHVNYYDWCRHSRSRSQSTIGASETQLLEPASLSSLSFSNMWLQASHPSLSTHNKVTSRHFLLTQMLRNIQYLGHPLPRNN